MPITSWPNEDQPREKLLRQGASSLTTAELIAIFINTGTRGKTALDLARTLLNEHGDIKKLVHANPQNLMQLSGFGRAKYATLLAAIELGRRYQEEPVHPGQHLNNSQMTRRFLTARLGQYEKEVFACLFMDTHFRLIAFEELFHGTINQAAIYPREIVRRCLHHNAAKVILAHNHPSGHTKPSDADRDITRLITEALALIDTQVVDHVIIGQQTHFSFAEMGLV